MADRLESKRGPYTTFCFPSECTSLSSKPYDLRKAQANQKIVPHLSLFLFTWFKLFIYFKDHISYAKWQFTYPWLNVYWKHPPNFHFCSCWNSSCIMHADHLSTMYMYWFMVCLLGYPFCLLKSNFQGTQKLL